MTSGMAGYTARGRGYEDLEKMAGFLGSLLNERKLKGPNQRFFITATPTTNGKAVCFIARPVNCCCAWGAAKGDRGRGPSGEWPEFECDRCRVHRHAFGKTDSLCKRHEREARR